MRDYPTTESITELLETEGLYATQIVMYLWLVSRFGYDNEFTVADFKDEYPDKWYNIYKQLRILQQKGLVTWRWHWKKPTRREKLFKII